eukprot:4185208-Prymnesium_polylepis.1
MLHVYASRLGQTRTFLERLRARKLLTRSTIVGMDANCVLNPSVDVLYPSNSRSSYQNTHASTLEQLLSGWAWQISTA